MKISASGKVILFGEPAVVYKLEVIASVDRGCSNNGFNSFQTKIGVEGLKEIE